MQEAAAASKAPTAAAPAPTPIVKEKPRKKVSSSSSKEDPNAPGVPVTLMYSERSATEKELVHTKTIKFTEKHARLDGHAISASSTDDSVKKSRKFFEWFLAPMSPSDFFEHYWEKRTFVLKRGAAGILRPGFEAPPKPTSKSTSPAEQENQHAYYGGWFSSKIIDQLMRSGELHYSTDIGPFKFYFLIFSVCWRV
jgi:hypothetical protein